MMGDQMKRHSGIIAIVILIVFLSAIYLNMVVFILPTEASELTTSEFVASFPGTTITEFELPAECNVTGANLKLSTQTDGGDYPEDIQLIFGETLPLSWSYRGEGHGAFGQQQYFSKGQLQVNLSYDADNINDTLFFNLPKNAEVNDASVKLTGFEWDFWENWIKSINWPDTRSYSWQQDPMPFVYNNNDPFKLKYSEAKLTLSTARDWTNQDVKALSLWFQGYPGSVGSFTGNFDGTYSMTGSGADIWDISGIGTGFHDEFHFAYKMLTGTGTITARVDSVLDTHDWAKAGVMIRETLDANSVHAFACVTPASGVASQGRLTIGAASFNYNQTGITAPHWVKLERDLSGNFTVTHSTNGSNWVPVEGATVQNIPMSSNVYVGLALTSHNNSATCEAKFSNVTITGNVSGQWTNQDIGIASNDAEPLYVAVSNAGGAPAVVVHDDPDAATIDTWTEWVIPLQAFADKGIVLTNVDSIAIGLGTQGNMTIPGGSGKMYFDDIRLYQSREAAE